MDSKVKFVNRVLVLCDIPAATVCFAWCLVQNNTSLVLRSVLGGACTLELVPCFLFLGQTLVV